MRFYDPSLAAAITVTARLQTLLDMERLANMRYGLFCEHLPDKDGERKITLGHRTFDTMNDARRECDEIRRQNLPFKAWPMPVNDPRYEDTDNPDQRPAVERLIDASDRDIAIGNHAFRAGFEAGKRFARYVHGLLAVEPPDVDRAWEAYTPPDDLCGG